ncbi:MAG TPA: HAMP domain-containing sensor histidine kinase, partial [Allocoleopsis sp.]
RNKKDKGEIDLYFFAASIFNRLGKIDSAIYYARLVNESKSEKKFGSYAEGIIHSNRLLANLYEKKGDLEKALYYERNYIAFLDSIMNVSGVQSFKARIKNLEDELEIQKQENESKNSRFLMIFISSLVAITLVILIFTYRNAQKYQKLNTQLETQKQELTSLNNIRSRMFSILSHDLRSPIGALKNMIDLYHTKTLSRQDFDSFTLDLKQNLNAILDTLNNILDWSFAQLKGKKPYIEPLNAYTIVNEQLELQAEVARQKHITIKNNIPKDFTIQADYNHFSLIARNLVNNAIKYTLKNGQIEINAAVTEGGKTIDFVDTGIGMDDDKLQALVQKKFNQSENYEGKGLGLQIVHDFLKDNN